MMHPLAILLIGLVTVIGLIIVLRAHAFIALVSAAIVVSLLAPGEVGEKIQRVAEAFGAAAGKIGIVIALAAVIGKCLMDSGAADRIVRAFLNMLGEKRAAAALMGSGFVLAVPVFFDTVFYLLVPLARSLWKRTQKNYTLYVTAIAGGAVITHTLVPPTPGPLMMAAELGIDLGMMILIGGLIAVPTAIVGLLICRVMNRLIDLPMRPLAGEPEPEPIDESDLPPLWLSLLPVVLPVVMISTNTVVSTIAKSETTIRGASAVAWTRAAQYTSLLGDANLALLLSAVIAMATLARKRRLTLLELGKAVETALLSGGVIILITAGGGAFGAMLAAAGVGQTIEQLAGQGSPQNAGVVMLLVGFAVAAVLKVAQGSGTVSMITAAAMLAAMNPTSATLGCNPVYLAAAIGSGSVIGSWMNDSGFWIFARMSGLTEVEALKTWSLLLVLLGITGMAFTLVLSRVMPLV